MGDLAGHERRGSRDWLGRSAILGLLGAACGIRRDGNFSAIDELGIAVAPFETGTLLRDFHTVQTVPTAKVKQPQSRPLALHQAHEVNTVLTQRDYRVSTLYGIALTGGDLHRICDALQRPAFTLYLGRKNCPLSAPLAPRLVEAPTVQMALGQVRVPPWYEAGTVAERIYTDMNEAAPGREIMRYDMPLDRCRWHFAERRLSVIETTIEPVL